MTDIIAPGLVPQAPAPLSVAVTVHGQQAVLHFSEPREFTGFSATESLQIGARLLVASVEADPAAAQAAVSTALAVVDAVYELRGDIKPAGGAAKHELIERHRNTLTQRLRVILNSQREQRVVSNSKLAKELTEVMLKEVFA
jgi:hypothetical protein